MKTILRRPMWVAFAGLVAWIGFATAFHVPESPGFLLEVTSNPSWLTGSVGLSPIASLGEWGRFVLYLVGCLAVLPTGFLTAAILTSVSCPAMDHRQIFGTTPVASRISVLATKPVAASLVVMFCVLLGASSVLLHPAVREVLVLAGLQYVPMYILLAWIHILLWAAVSSCLFAATRSRWITLACVVLLDVGCHFLFPSVLSLSSQGRLVWMSYITYEFVSLYAPLGILPIPFLLRGVTEAALAMSLIGVTFCVRARFPEWPRGRSSSAWALVGIGVLIAISAVGGSTRAVQRQIAPFALWELWQGQASLDRPYVWSNDGQLLVFPGQFTVLRLPTSLPVPHWVVERVADSQIQRYAIGDVTVRTGDPTLEATGPAFSQEHTATFLRDAQDLIVIYPPDRPYPTELEGMFSRFLHRLKPLLERAANWQEVFPEILVVGPADFLHIETVLASPEVLLTSAFTMSDAAQATTKWWWIAWALAGTAGVDEQARCYLTLFLMNGSHGCEVREVLAWLHDEAQGGSLHDEERAVEQLREGNTEAWVVCEAPVPLCAVAWMNPEAAFRVLEHWEHGEQIGHGAYILSLRDGG